ncbi:MAG: RDD family protein, partial [Candidatus Hodarchaeota archaeon]
FCPFCGGKIEAVDAVFCPHCGASLEGVPPAKPTEYREEPPPARYVPPEVQFASIGNRFVALLLDFIILIILYVFIFVALYEPDEEEVDFAFYWIVTFIGIFYWLFLEGLNDGQTIGKMAAGIRVVKIDKATGELSRCTMGASVIRNLLRIVDNLPFLYIIGLISIASSDYEQRVGDRVADTIVIKT